MANTNGTILSVEEEKKLLAPIDAHIGKIQARINDLRKDGTDQVTALTNHIAIVKENANFTKAEKAEIIAKDQAQMQKAKAVEQQNKAEINALIDPILKRLPEPGQCRIGVGAVSAGYEYPGLRLAVLTDAQLVRARGRQAIRGGPCRTEGPGRDQG